MTTLAELTTLRVGGPAARYEEAATEAEFVDAIRGADDEGIPLLVIGGGSNLLVTDAGFDGLVLRDARQDVRIQDDGFCGGVSVTATAGASWDALVEQAVASEWIGLEALSGIPGSVGAAPVQNIGAYGAELADTLASVRVWDRERAAVRTLALMELGFGYRTSILKRSVEAPYGPTPRYVVLDVTVHTRFGTRSAPVRYQQLADALGISQGDTASIADVREAVLALRSSKGMVLDADDHDTWSAGSFFTNPVVPQGQVPEGAPQYSASGSEGDVKTSAAWLIEKAGIHKGFALPGSRAAISSKHTLALTNRGDASAQEVLELATHVQVTVARAWGIALVPEPVIVADNQGP
ncbi:UDP-N-acetylmuramate dehydrogenase [Demequina sp.]|uniref:UDP-N-acetylmuramate dehydrogenase n=1 Tax=Demequina sp. TaxID=2050685 RepID=UPI003D10CF03